MLDRVTVAALSLIILAGCETAAPRVMTLQEQQLEQQRMDAMLRAAEILQRTSQSFAPPPSTSFNCVSRPFGSYQVNTTCY